MRDTRDMRLVGKGSSADDDDRLGADEDDGVRIAVHVDEASGRVTLEASWRREPGGDGQARCSLTLVIDPHVMERYAALDDAGCQRVQALLDDASRAALDAFPAQPCGETFDATIEITDAMLDAASRIH